MKNLSTPFIVVKKCIDTFIERVDTINYSYRIYESIHRTFIMTVLIMLDLFQTPIAMTHLS